MPNLLPNPNSCLMSDSYKLNHWAMMPKGSESVFSYFEARNGAQFPETVFFGLQYIIKRFLTGVVVTKEAIDEAENLCQEHFGNNKYFNRTGWEHILNVHGGKLPVIIRAIPEGTVVPISNALMTVENTDPECYWLTNFLETILSHVWYPTTVATLSRATKKVINKYLQQTSDGGSLNFMLHDFGYRGTEVYDSAGIGGLAHLVNFLGTDTVAAMEHAKAYYNASFEGLAYSVAATEHSVMTALGPEGEEQVVENLLDIYPTGILSVVSDSYSIYNFVDNILGKKFKDRILARDGIFVTRPDSISPKHKTPEKQMVWIAESLWKNFGGTMNSKGYKVINPKIRMLWGDGIDIIGIEKILEELERYKFATENIACFGMGGGLLQKVNRDTQRFAFKCCAQKRDGVWHDIFKKPVDVSKASKKGRLKLIINTDGLYETVNEDVPGTNLLIPVFENGKLLVDQKLSEIRERAKLL